MAKQYDMLLLSVPSSDLDVVPCAPALLKGIAEAHGFSIKTYDTNIDLLEMYGQNPSIDFVELMSSWLIETDNTYKYHDVIQSYYNRVIDTVLTTPCTYLGISVFSIYRHKATFELCRLLKEKIPDIKIVLGGRGAVVNHHISIEKYLSPSEKFLTFDQIMLKRKLVDRVISGDAEDAIIDLLDGELDVNDTLHKTALNNKLEYPYPNFDDDRLDMYTGQAGNRQLPIVSSKGCVRSCDFCDVAAHFTRFQSKDGNHIAKEMIYLSNKYNINEFAFMDSIANGNMKTLRAACQSLKEYNQSVCKEKRLSWAANWICRPPMIIKPEFFDLLKDSGCKSLTIGAEHGSNRVLELMNKKTTVEGLYYELEQLDRVGIESILNLLTGHWAETYDDFLKSVEMILKIAPYCANGTVSGFSAGPSFHLLDNTPAADFATSGLNTLSSNFNLVCYSRKNNNLTLKVKLARLYFVYKMLFRLNLSTNYSGGFLMYVNAALDKVSDQIDDFYENQIDKKSWEVCPSVELMDNVDSFVDTLIKDLYPTTKIKIDVYSNGCNGAPRMKVKFNGTTYYYNELDLGDNVIEFEVPYLYNGTASLEIGMDNKTVNDTQIDNNGNIIADKNIIFNKIVIDKIDVAKDVEFYFRNGKYVEDGCVLEKQVSLGLYSNSSVMFEFKEPFWVHYLKHVPLRFDYLLGAGSSEENYKLLDSVREKILKFKY